MMPYRVMYVPPSARSHVPPQRTQNNGKSDGVISETDKKSDVTSTAKAKLERDECQDMPAPVKHIPRGGKERENFDDMIAFLREHRAMEPTENKPAEGTAEPQSAFDWDDEEIEKKKRGWRVAAKQHTLAVSKSILHLRKQKKVHGEGGGTESGSTASSVSLAGSSPAAGTQNLSEQPPIGLGIVAPVSVQEQPSYPESNALGIFIDECVESARANLPFNSPNTLVSKAPVTNDSSSIYSQNLSDVPAPLSIRKIRSPEPNSPPSTPLNNGVLKVGCSTQQIRPSPAGSFTPRRTDSFSEKLKETSKMREQHLGNHPALRGIEDSERKYSTETKLIDTILSAEDQKRIDSGIGMGAPRPPQRPWTATGEQRNFAIKPKDLGTDKSISNVVEEHKSEHKSEQKGELDQEQDCVAIADLQSLRNEVGLGPLMMPKGPNVPKHPNHSFMWNTEKIMCRDIHNPAQFLSPMPSLPNGQVRMNGIPSKQVKTSARTNKDTAAGKSCHNCGSFCCRYANLVVTSKINTSSDIMEEMVRNKAQQRLAMLRSLHPNGVEHYETFFQCTICNNMVCPKCAQKCTEPLCGQILCDDCRLDGTDATCQEHNVF